MSRIGIVVLCYHNTELTMRAASFDEVLRFRLPGPLAQAARRAARANARNLSDVVRCGLITELGKMGVCWCPAIDRGEEE